MNCRIYSFDILKFFAILFIAIMHFHWQAIPQAYLGVELCFMITGFFIYKNYDKYTSLDFLTIIKKRIGSFYPYYMIAVIASYLFISHNFHIEQFFSEIFFLGHLGITINYEQLPLWFLGAYTYCFILYLSIIKIVSKPKSLYIIGLLSVLMLCAMMRVAPVMNLNIALEKEQFIGIIPYGLARGIVGMGFGYLIGVFCERFKSNPLKSAAIYFEVFAFAFYGYIIFHSVTPKFDVISYILFAILIISLSYKTSVLAKGLEFLGEKLKFLFLISMQIYIYHGLVKLFMFKHLPVPKHYGVYILFYIISVLILCISVRAIYTFLANFITNAYSKIESSTISIEDKP